LAESIVAEIE